MLETKDTKKEKQIAVKLETLTAYEKRYSSNITAYRGQNHCHR